MRLVGVFFFGRQKNRLKLRVAFSRSAMREEGLLGVRPKMGIECLHPFGGTDAQHGFPIAFARAFEQAGEHVFEALAFEMVEERFRHFLFTPHPPSLYELRRAGPSRPVSSRTSFVVVGDEAVQDAHAPTRAP